MQLMLVAAFLVSLSGCALLVRLGRAGMMLDRPNERSLHVAPTPRTGGLAIAAGLLVVVAVIFPVLDVAARLLVVGWLLVFAVSFLDDLCGLPVWIRLPVHLIAGLLVVIAPGFPDSPFTMVLGLFWIVWGTNLFNFMDGMDGLAGSMAIVGGAALALALSASPPVALLCGAAAAAAGGFLIFNFPPARLFMGDAGSAPLGFLFSAVAVRETSSGAMPAWLPLLVFLPFIADATITLARRAVAGKPVWKPHREHAYQGLVLGGVPERRVLAIEVGLMLLCAAAALMPPGDGPTGWLLLGVMGAGLLGGYWVIMHRMN